MNVIVAGVILLLAGTAMCVQIILELRMHRRWDAEDLADREAWALLIGQASDGGWPWGSPKSDIAGDLRKARPWSSPDSDVAGDLREASGGGWPLS